MDIQSLITEKLPINKLIQIRSFNSAGQVLNLIGYVREIRSDGYVIWENNDEPEQFKIKCPLTFKEIVVK